MGGKSGSNSGANTNSVDKTATVVDVKAFGDEFDANQVAAESKYKEQVHTVLCPNFKYH